MNVMNIRIVLYWLPRILSVLFILFISAFALDVSNESNWPLALFMHLIPSFLLIGITIVAWKNEGLGGFLFLLIGFALLIFTNFEALILGIPAFGIGALFLGKKYFFKS